MEIIKKRKNNLNFTLLLILILGLVGIIIGGGVLVKRNQLKEQHQRQQAIANLETRLKEIQEFRDQFQQAYQLQNSHLTSTVELANKPAAHSFFSDLLTTYAEKFASSKNLNTSNLLLQFEGFHLDPNTGNGSGSMGRCSIEDKAVHISLTQLYLLNKFGLERFFTTPQGEYIDISFDKMIETCSHELAHYLQFVKWGRSSCESDLTLRKGDYDPILAKEHEEWRQEIYQLIKKDFPSLERKWKGI